MNFFEENRALFDTLSMIILGTLALIVSLRVFPMAMFLLPVVFVVLGVNHGVKYNIIGLVVSSIIMGLILDISSAVLIVILFLPLSIVLVLMIRNNEKPSRILLGATIAFFISMLVLIMLLNVLGDINFIEASGKIIKMSFDNQLEALKEAGLKGDELETFQGLYESVYETLTITMPSMFMIFSLVISYLNYLITTVVLRKENYDLKYRPIFSEFKLPKNIFLGTLIMLIGSYILLKLDILKARAVYENIIVIVNFLFTLQGLALIYFKLKESSLNKVIRVFIFVLTIFLLSLFGRLVSMLGILDSIFDFRKPKPKSN